MEISMVPSQFLNVVLEETKRNKSSSETPLSLSPCPFPKDENNCDDRIKTDGDKESLKRKHSIIEDRPHSNGLSEQEKRDLTARLPKALLAECTVEIHTSPPRERRAIRPRFDARVSPIYTAPKDRTRYNDWNIPGLQIIREAPLNLSASNSKIPPNKLCSSSSFLPENYRKKYNSEDIDYTTTNAHDALQLIEAVYSDQDDEDSHSREDLLIGAQKPTNGERKMRRPVPNLIEVSLTARANLRSAQSARNLGNPSLNPLTNFYSALASNLESLPTREAFANLPRSMLMANDSITSPILRKNVASPDQKFSFKCEHCPNVYPNRGALWQHSVATHSVEKTCECNICGRKFYRNCSLALHLKSHSEEEYCTCKECGKSFTRLINLERHMKVHSVSSDRYQCEHCDKSFPDRANLLRHSVCHGAASTQSRTHQCDTCGKSYKSKDHLDIHWQATHAVISCSMCAKSFTSFSELARHESAVHPDRPGQRYSCDQCGKSYSQIAVLRKHMISHTGERLRCSTCGIEFTQRSSLLRHVKRMHAKVQGDRNSGGVLRYGPEAVLGNENLRRLISLDIASASGGGIMGQNADQIKKSKTINALIERLNSSGQTKITGNPMHADSNPKSVEITKTSNQDSKVQNEDLSGSSLINPQALLEKFYNSNSSIRYLLEQKMNHLSPYSNLSVAAEFLKQIDSKSNVSSPLIASLNLNRNAFLTNSLLTASNNMALAAMMGAYGTTVETVPSDRFSNDVSVSEENSADDSLEDDDGGDYSEETDDDEADDNGSMEVNKYVADINDNEDSDNDNFVIDEDAIEEECSDSSTDADVMSNKNDQDLNSHDGDPQYRENNAGQNIDIKSDEETNEEFAIDTKTTNSFDSTKRTTELQNGIFLE